MALDKSGYGRPGYKVGWSVVGFLSLASPLCCGFVTPAGNVSGHKSFLDAAQHEKLREREALEAGLMFSRDRLIEMIPVSPPYEKCCREMN